MNRILTTTAVLFVGALLLTGCSNIGDTNPITPEKMQQMRQKEGDARSNFKPSNTPPPASGSK